MIRKIISKVRDLNIKGSGRVSFYLAKFLISKPKGKKIVNTIYNFKLELDPIKDSGVERAIYYYGTYEKGTLNIIDKILNKGDVFVDVGANIGLMSIFASLKVEEKGKVIAFEPNPKTKEILKRNIDLNKNNNIKIEGFALSNEIKEGRIYDRWDINRGGASLIKPEVVDNSYTIQETTFTNYFKKSDIVKLVKVDVEGYELNVLKGAKDFLLNSKYPPSLIIEFSSNRSNTFGDNLFPLFFFLNDLKIYRFFKASKGKEKISKLVEFTNKEELPIHDNVFCFTNEQIKLLSDKLFKKNKIDLS